MRAAAAIFFFIIIAMVYGALNELRLGGGSLTNILITSILSFLAVLVHELGHAFAVRRTGGVVDAIMVMPFELRFRPCRLGLSRGSGRDLGGYVEYLMPGGEPRRVAATIAFAGPAANFALAAALLLFTLWLSWSGFEGLEIGGSGAPPLAIELVPAGPGVPLPARGLPSDAETIAELAAGPWRIDARAIVLVSHALAILSFGMGLANLIPFAGSDGNAIARAFRLKGQR